MSASIENNASSNPVPDKRFLRWMFRISVGLVLGFFAFVGIAHTSFGRPLLAVLTGVPGCPLGLDDVNGAELEKQRQATLLTQNVEAAPAEALPARGFVLGTTPFSEAVAWAKERSMQCDIAREGILVRCSDLKLSDESIAYEVDLHSDPAGKLVAFDVSRRSTEAVISNRWFEAQAKTLASSLGKPDRENGQAATVWLAAAPFRQRLVEYRRRNYKARVTVTHLNRGGYVVREQYQWADSDVAAR